MNLSFLEDVLPPVLVHYCEPLAAHTAFRIGGPAQALVEPQTEAQLCHVVTLLREKGVPFFVIGRGSNLLVSDEGFDGVIIKIRLETVALDGDFLWAGAGLSLRKLYERALEHGFTGLEFAAGIPGSVGGAVYMNAGAYGGEMKDVLHSVRALTSTGQVKELGAEELGLAYRKSTVEAQGLILLSASFRLTQGDRSASRLLAERLMERRRSRQPLEYPSAGSTFKRPPGHYAGTLIESCGLKGASCGGACVSRKHAGFVINADHATAADVSRLIGEVRHTVMLLTGITLEPEVQSVGIFP